MKGVDFPVFKTRIDGVSRKFGLNDPEERKEYFGAKAGKEVEALKKYLSQNKTFVAYLLGKKNSGKGTYSKMFMEVVDSEHVSHLSVGDIVRDVHKSLETEDGKTALLNFLGENYRGYHSPEETIDLILGRSQSTLIPSELILALIKFEISKRPRQAIFIDGFPRAFDQIGYTLFLKELIGYRDDPDFFVFIDVAESVIDERIKYRVICPNCNTPRNLRLLTTKNVGFDKERREFYLMCDNSTCNKQRMIPKEGDELGISPIRGRLEVEEKIFKQLLNLKGVSKIYLRNSVPADRAGEYVDDYEITPGYYYDLDKDTDLVRTIEKPWTINDDNNVPSYSLLPAAVELALIKQTAEALNLS